MKRSLIAPIALLLLAGAAMSAGAANQRFTPGWAESKASSHPNALWRVVHDLCVVDMKASGLAAPCAAVNLDGGYAVVKDIQNATQYLLVPTDKIAGIESAVLQTPSSPNYWRDAWAVKALLEKHLGRDVPREDFGLAINSVNGRTQDQLHIHIDCVRPGVVADIRAHAGRIGAGWSPLTTGPNGTHYRARWLNGTDLGARDPFKILARTDPVARKHMGEETLVVIGAARPNGAPGFVVMADRGAGPDGAAGEELLDHHCRILRGGA